jgi:hypothetical protein
MGEALKFDFIVLSTETKNVRLCQGTEREESGRAKKDK